MTSSMSCTTANLRIDFEDTETGSTMILRGTLDADAAPVLNEVFERLTAQGRTSLTIDLGEVDMISSAGVGSLISGVGGARDEGGAVCVSRSSAAVRHVFEMLGLVDYLECPRGEA